MQISQKESGAKRLVGNGLRLGLGLGSRRGGKRGGEKEEEEEEETRQCNAIAIFDVAESPVFKSLLLGFSLYCFYWIAIRIIQIYQ